MRTQVGTSGLGPRLEVSITPLHSFVAEPLWPGLFFLAGDAAQTALSENYVGLPYEKPETQLLFQDSDLSGKRGNGRLS